MARSFRCLLVPEGLSPFPTGAGSVALEGDLFAALPFQSRMDEASGPFAMGRPEAVLQALPEGCHGSRVFPAEAGKVIDLPGNGTFPPAVADQLDVAADRLVAHQGHILVGEKVGRVELKRGSGHCEGGFEV